MSKVAKDKALNEPKILKNLIHRNLVKFFEDFMTQDKKSENLCIVMELIEGETIEDLIKQKKEESNKFSTEIIIDFFVQLVDVLSYVNN